MFGAPVLTSRTIAKEPFRNGEALCQTMYQATLNEILLIEDPDYGIRGELTLDARGAARFSEEIYLVFGPLGESIHSALQHKLYRPRRPSDETRC